MKHTCTSVNIVLSCTLLLTCYYSSLLLDISTVALKHCFPIILCLQRSLKFIDISASACNRKLIYDESLEIKHVTLVTNIQKPYSAR